MEAESSKYSLTEGGILKKLLMVAIPIMGTHFMQMAYNLTDMFWLGRLGSDAVAAVGSSGMYLWLSFGFILIGRMGAEIGTAQYLGRGEKKGALALSQISMFIALVLGILFGCAMIFFSSGLIAFFNFQEQEVAAQASGYLFICGFSTPLVFLSSVAMGTFIGSGNSRTPFIFNALGLGINIILDPILIFGLSLGVRGAALATMTAQLISSLGLLIALFVSKNRPFDSYTLGFTLKLEKLKMLLKWSLPIGLESIFLCFLSMVTSRFIASFGSDAMAVSKLGAQIESLSWLIGGGFSSALIAFTGQNYGAEKWDRIRRGTKISAALMAVWGLVVALVHIFLGGPIFSIFLSAPELIALGAQYCLILGFAQIFMNLEGVASGVFKGTGRTIPPSLAGLVSNMAKPVLALILSRTALGLYGIWLAIAISTAGRGLWIVLWFLAAERKSKIRGSY